jgi:hypothetical protein
VSFQVTILKVLARQPEGYLPLAELRNNVAILIFSGPDWTDRTKRIAARSSGLDIFSQAMVLPRPVDGRSPMPAEHFSLIARRRYLQILKN